MELKIRPFSWLMLGCSLVVPLCMMAGGWLMWKHCPKNINGFMGYRTGRSMKNRDTWRFANEYCGRLWWKGSWWLLCASLLGLLPLMGKSEDTLSWANLAATALQLTALLACCGRTQRALRQNFTRDGRRRE